MWGYRCVLSRKLSLCTLALVTSIGLSNPSFAFDTGGSGSSGDAGSSSDGSGSSGGAGSSGGSGSSGSAGSSSGNGSAGGAGSAGAGSAGAGASGAGSAGSSGASGENGSGLDGQSAENGVAANNANETSSRNRGGLANLFGFSRRAAAKPDTSQAARVRDQVPLGLVASDAICTGGKLAACD